ncbi:putative 4-amino-4-deoxy-L-arabinose-phosphoundecaprenol flippase subunit ArnF [Marinomonas spartinae]|uniref:Putative 4-amino-4-deoxy-L-arabinose-phosphoundecaprenol flippase subunit ArnF n=1 Tax=Marinomonas spartinae TaxID=1792290 RepID=A0A1A8T112_9GAMM|nr:EamA family transporter [Marinomonas spartinae]SBS24843.1 putative 4-amino-4-deoxy-L-arabinose-phosphoundecaprenol flippase subunit ArnF [Marinomonas spartinae]SBS25343.1 putative 4-amino-4-deoxy-L-arabinose-phosphoundecaprenol flippase subunit ArnF [Marinomonas spartinae]
MRSWFAIIASLLLVTLAQLLMKSGMSGMPVVSLNWLMVEGNGIAFLQSHLSSLIHVFFGLMCYGLSLGCWMLALKKIPLSVAYPCLSISYVLVTLLAHWVFAEPLSWVVLVGSVLIMLGVSLITYKPAGHRAH